MIYRLVILLLINSLAFSYALREFDKKPKSKYHLARVINKYPQKDIIKILRDFVKETRPTRIVGSKGHFKSVDFIINHIKEKTQDSGVVIVDEFSPDIDRAISMYDNDLKKVMDDLIEKTYKSKQCFAGFKKKIKIKSLEAFQETVNYVGFADKDYGEQQKFECPCHV